ncbi:acyltransferase [Aeromicrobium flavum]|uniref:Acyltransferase n=1 Tax=Aeromicrobium flavum TaxID=416568 RepID=A0A512HTG4_9ACTN|nr:acyltransferase family protein [Aeromicrobium flavum]GEO88695.1 acyltransferase [Aeromicrobium flavum]
MSENLRTAPPAAAPSPRGRKPKGPSVRTDIQALRALAVSVVVAFHLWPERVPGGYVGVDVFFVISGFLITLHLVQKPPTSLAGLGSFWARRVRRLIPAAAIVLVATTAASWLWLPSTQFADIARQVTGSALYVQNWVLADSATDYLAAENAPTPVQHYWSLSIEEQFYLFWPLVIAAVVALRRAWLPVVTALIFAASLAWSIHLTDVDPGAAYFVTPARIWELLLGALVALAVHRGLGLGRAGGPVALLGLALMVVAVFGFDRDTAFPGSAALVPTLGAALVLLAAVERGGPWGWRPVQVVGDWSYPIYLWHWPLVVIAPLALGADQSWATDAFVLVATVALAGLTVRFVEKPLRFHPRVVARKRATFAMLAVATVLSCGSAWALTAAPDDASSSGLAMTPVEARDDKPAVYPDDCWASAPFTTHPVCHYGAEDSDRRVALIGNSHAGHWQPALATVAEDRGWTLDTYLASQCYTVDVDIAFPDPAATRGCRDWNAENLRRIVASRPSLVVISNRTVTMPLADVDPEDAQDVAQRAYADTLDRLTSRGIPVLVIRDTPAAAGNVPDCVALNADDLTACDRPRSAALESDPLAAAGRADDSGLVTVLDVSDRFCDDETCRVVVDDQIAYFDHGHLTATFSRSLAPEVARAAARAVRSASGAPR